MRKHRIAPDVGKSEVGVGQDVEVRLLDGEKDLFLEFLGHRQVASVLDEVGGELAVGLRNLVLGGTGSMDGLIAGVDWGDVGMPSPCQVERCRHDKCQVAVLAAASRRVNGTGVGVKFLLEDLKTVVRGGPDDRRENGMREGESRR